MTTLLTGYGGILKVFLLGFNPNALSREMVFNYFNGNVLFKNWLTILPGQMFFVSESSIHDVSAALRGQFPNQFLFVTEVSPPSCDGWMPSEIWSFIANPMSAKTMVSQLDNFTALRKLYDK